VAGQAVARVITDDYYVRFALPPRAARSLQPGSPVGVERVARKRHQGPVGGAAKVDRSRVLRRNSPSDVRILSNSGYVSDLDMLGVFRYLSFK
jgi:hypothetical protein